LNPLASNWALGSASPLLGGLVNQFPTFNPETKQQIHPLTHFATLFSINKRKKKTTLSYEKEVSLTRGFDHTVLVRFCGVAVTLPVSQTLHHFQITSSSVSVWCMVGRQRRGRLGKEVKKVYSWGFLRNPNAKRPRLMQFWVGLKSLVQVQ